MFITLADIACDGNAFLFSTVNTKELGPREDYSLGSIKQIGELYLVFICDIKKLSVGPRPTASWLPSTVSLHSKLVI